MKCKQMLDIMACSNKYYLFIIRVFIYFLLSAVVSLGVFFFNRAT